MKLNPTWCIFLSLSEHVQCIYQFIMAICELWWPLMASIFRKNYIFIHKCFFSQFLLQYHIRYTLRTSKRYIVRGFIRGQMDLQLRPWTFIQKTPTWCTFLSLSFNVHYHGKLFGRHLWPLMASKNEKYHVLVFFFL